MSSTKCREGPARHDVLVAAFATRGFGLDILQLVLAEHRLLVGETVLDERILNTCDLRG